MCELKEIFGWEHSAVLGRQLTKKFEDIVRWDFNLLCEYIQKTETGKIKIKMKETIDQDITEPS